MEKRDRSQYLILQPFLRFADYREPVLILPQVALSLPMDSIERPNVYSRVKPVQIRAPTVLREIILKLHPGCITWIPEVVAEFDSSDFLITQIMNVIFLLKYYYIFLPVLRRNWT